MESVLDPSTQVYNAVASTLMAFQPLAKTLRTMQIFSAQKFQQLLTNYQAGDAPAILFKPIATDLNITQTNSMALSWTEEIGVAMSSDYVQTDQINDFKWKFACALVLAPKNFGLTGATPARVFKWTLVGGKMDLGMTKAQAAIDAAAGGASRWQVVYLFRIECALSFDEFRVFAQQYQDALGT